MSDGFYSQNAHSRRQRDDYDVYLPDTVQRGRSTYAHRRSVSFDQPGSARPFRRAESVDAPDGLTDDEDDPRRNRSRSSARSQSRSSTARKQVAIYDYDDRAMTRPYESAHNHYDDSYDHQGRNAYHVEKHRRHHAHHGHGHHDHHQNPLHAVKDFVGEHFDKDDPTTWIIAAAGAALGGVTVEKFRKYRGGDEDGYEEEDEYRWLKAAGGAAAGAALFSELRHQYVKYTETRPEKAQRMKRRAKDVGMAVVKEKLKA